MKIKEISEILGGEFLCGEEHGEKDVFTACASDMMSDVLAYVKERAVLVTGLCNPQVIRTAEMMDMDCIVMVRGKSPDAMMIKLAKDLGIPVIATDMRMFGACGLLYEAGLRSEED